MSKREKRGFDVGLIFTFPSGVIHNIILEDEYTPIEGIIEEVTRIMLSKNRYYKNDDMIIPNQWFQTAKVEVKEAEYLLPKDDNKSLREIASD